MTTDRHFHLFPSLPPELQDHIWSLAVRPLPGPNHIHTFYLADHYVNKATVSNNYQADFLHFNPGRHGWTLGVPREANRSAYRLDSGLRRACRQSRKALMNYFGSNKYWAAGLDGFQPSPLAEIDICDEPGKPAPSISPNAHTGVYIDTNNKKQYITIRPKTDLVHILDPVGHYWFHQYAGDYVPLFDAPARGWGSGQGGPGFVGQNVAVDFEPDWAEGISGPLADMLDVLYTDAVRTVWFVDYRLRRRDTQDGGDVGSTHTADTGSEGMVFYGWGFRLVEVKRQQLGLWLEPGSKTAFDLFDRFERDTNGRLEVDDPDRLGVLAVESV